MKWSLKIPQAASKPSEYKNFGAISSAVSPTMVEQVRRRLGEKVRELQANLDEPLTITEPGSFAIRWQQK